MPKRLAEGRLPPTVESVTEEIGGIVAERQALRAAGAGEEELEANRRRLTAAQGELSRLLIQRYLPERGAA
jgi:hypothetical protein